MKKHLIAAAVAAVVAAPAMAQVSISGILDTGISSRDNGTQTITSAQSGTLSTPGMRFTGTEDLGGGLRAGFTVLKEFNTTTGAEDLQLFDQVFVNVSGGFGSITAGKHGFPARNANGVGASIGNVGLVGSVEGNALRALGDERDGSFTYTTPNLSGFTVALSASPRSAARAATTSGAGRDGTGQTTGILVSYSLGKLTVAYSELEAKLAAGAGERDTTNFAANYDFGFMRAGLIALRDKPDSTTPAVKNNATVLNVTVPVSGAFSLIGAIHNYSGKRAAGVNPTADGLVAGGVYALSKRTNVYAVYANVDNNATGRYSITTMAAPAAGIDQSTLAVGLRHSF